MNTIVILGSCNCGKTVLLSVLAHYYEDEQNGLRVTPYNKEAFDFARENWQLLSTGQWPPPTPPLQAPIKLVWTLSVQNKEFRLLSADIAGESLSRFMRDHLEPEIQKSSGFLKMLSGLKKGLECSGEKSEEEFLPSLLNEAVGICILVDLKREINQDATAEEQRFFFQAVINYLKEHGKDTMPIALVPTQINCCGSITQWQHVLNERYLSKVQLPALSVIPVDAVAQTVCRETPEGTFRLQPAPGFGSEGLDKLVQWMGRCAGQKQRKEKCWRYLAWVGGIGISLYLLFFLVCTCFAAFSSIKLPSPIVAINPIIGQINESEIIEAEDRRRLRKVSICEIELKNVRGYDFPSNGADVTIYFNEDKPNFGPKWVSNDITFDGRGKELVVTEKHHVLKIRDRDLSHEQFMENINLPYHPEEIWDALSSKERERLKRDKSIEITYPFNNGNDDQIKVNAKGFGVVEGVNQIGTKPTKMIIDSLPYGFDYKITLKVEDY